MVRKASQYSTRSAEAQRSHLGGAQGVGCGLQHGHHVESSESQAREGKVGFCFLTVSCIFHLTVTGCLGNHLEVKPEATLLDKASDSKEW